MSEFPYMAIIVKPKPCCYDARLVGNVITVEGFAPNAIRTCPCCGMDSLKETTWAWVTGSLGAGSIELSRLKRLPPPDEVEDVEIDLEKENLTC